MGFESQKIGRAEINNCDCMDFLKGCEDNQFDLAIVDPPYFSGPDKLGYYGERTSKTGVTRKAFEKIGVWEIPEIDYFNELKRISLNQIIWGINYFEFAGMVSGRLIWDKVNDNSSFSKCEIASCSLIETVQQFRYQWNGMLQGGFGNKKKNEKRIHPTQKPVALYEWILQNYAKEGDSILDTHMGSGSIAIATNKHGFDLTACELDKDYYQSACKRIREAHNQPDMFTPSTTEPKQEVLL